MHVCKKKCATAVALALGIVSSSHANEVTLYGSVGAAFESLDNTAISTTEVSNTHSVFGLKGVLNVNDDLSAVYLFDTFVGIDAGSGAGANDSLFGGGRDGWVGLSGEEWGIVALGFQGRPWKTATNHLDLFGSTIADYSAVMGTMGDRDLNGASDNYFDGGIGNSLIYFGPDINGLSWHAQYGADENDDGSNDFGIQLNYSRDALYLSLSHDVDGQVSGSSDVDATKLAVSYTLQGKTVITAMYDTISIGSDARNAYYFAAAHRISNSTLKFAYAMADDIDGATNSGASYYAFGVSHMLDPNLEVYALYSGLDNDSAGAYTYISSPHTSSNSNSAIAAFGDDSSVFAAGIRYHFAWNNQ
ncbi:MAG: porin [Thiotrichaceae bacterium]|nr:porin [Thiotrichaceae bacterium]